MKTNFLDHFRLKEETENFSHIAETIHKGVVFRGTNLWILMIAIFIASLGLNVNSTAVIIGAMLISPLMGPIMGLGFGLALHDLVLLRKAAYNFSVATGISLATSTFYFLLTPLSEAHSEILARTSPNVYDVLIALFGGFAGMLATSSKQKGNVIPGVAIATALMPPLCTAGYGIATLSLEFFFGAFYLFLINSVFIALASFFACRMLRFPFINQPNPVLEAKARRLVSIITLLTLVPSIYFAFDIVQQSQFRQQASRFIQKESDIPGNLLIQKAVDSKSKSITLVYVGEPIDTTKINSIKATSLFYNLDSARIFIKLGISNIRRDQTTQSVPEIRSLLENETEKVRRYRQLTDSLESITLISGQLFKELQTLHPQISSLSYQPELAHSEHGTDTVWAVKIRSVKPITADEKERMTSFLRIRTAREPLQVTFEDPKSKRP